MTLRLSKSLLVLAVAFFYTLVVFDNTTDYNSNYQFVVHVLKMDTTFSGNHGMWRSTSSAVLDTVFYLSIILWEAITCALCWWCGIRMLRALRLSSSHFARAKAIGIVALTLGMLMWFVAFLCIGSEWFLMWQSKIWNGQDAAFRMFVVLGILLLYLTTPEPDFSGPPQ